MKLELKKNLLQKRRWRIRKKVKGTAERPRLAVHFSNKHIYAQCIDDSKGHTLAYVSSVGAGDAKANIEGAVALGKTIAEKAKAAGIEAVVFDRAGRRYHGCVKSFAEAAREAGLQF
ncbi:50S ribosomal protein L18 [Coraliomargarita parva]|uniref:50S ribosomal protein L18 n=1 Tax=Coraliomargarita parva TaxID=3014050 RepID=UPI0022B35B4A|nr:50S ribosomal protein L18 [Coraliomargarita parva]